MRDFLVIGSTPPEEPCVQVTQENPSYLPEQKKECAAYMEAIRKKLGEEPEGAYLAIKTFPHEFGTYAEVVVYYDDESKEATDYAYKCESDGPATWAEVGMTAPDVGESERR
jgi:hypothetical protein